MKKTGRSGKQSGRPAKLDTRNVRWWRGQVVSCTDLLELIELFPFRKASSCAKPFIRVQICNLFVSSWASFLFAFNRSLWLQYHIFNKNDDGFFCSFRLRFQRKCAIIPSYTALYGFLSTLELEYWFLKRLLRIDFFFSQLKLRKPLLKHMNAFKQTLEMGIMILLHAPAFKNAYKMSYYSLEMFPKVKKLLVFLCPSKVMVHARCAST